MRDTPPFRADHVGSLLRPPALLEAREAHSEGRIDDDGLRAAEDGAVRELVAMQADVGLRSATDGEMRRGSWHMDFIYALEGIERRKDNLALRFKNESGEIEFTPSAAYVTEKLALGDVTFASAFEFLRDTVDGVTPKQTIPSPSMVYYRGGRHAIDESVYPGLDAFWDDLTAAYADEVSGMYDLGCRYLQLDDTSLAYVNDPNQRDELKARGDDPERIHLTFIEAINRSIAGRPDDMAITTHMCRGNYRSSWIAEGGYEFVAEALFSELDVDGFFLEFDDERSGGFEPLRFVPESKQVVLGLVTTKRPELEQKDALKRRIEEASRFVDIDQICLSPQCGFSSTVEGNDLTADEQAAKLRLIVETADEVWG